MQVESEQDKCYRCAFCMLISRMLALLYMYSVVPKLTLHLVCSLDVMTPSINPLIMSSTESIAVSCVSTEGSAKRCLEKQTEL